MRSLSKTFNILFFVKPMIHYILNNFKSEWSVQKPNKSRFNFIDGYRGSLAFVVLAAHSITHYQCEIVNLVIGLAQNYGVAGFFMLSAFLLTYRLLNELQNISEPKRVVLSIAKFFIRRFTRIYLYYIMFYVFYSNVPPYFALSPPQKFKEKLIEIILLRPSEGNHLWTIHYELKYYFFIPIYCIIARLLNRCQVFLFIFSFLCTVFYLLSFFFITSFESYLLVALIPFQYYFLMFFIFFLGSLVGHGLYIIEKYPKISETLKHGCIKFVFNHLSLFIALVGFKRCMYVRFEIRKMTESTVYWSIVLFLTLLCRPTTISNFFAKSTFLRNLGQISYSIYLLHPSMVNTFRTHFFLKHLYQFELIALFIFVLYYMAKVLYILVEKPLIDLANYLCKKLDNYFENRSIKINDQVKGEITKNLLNLT